MRETELRGFAGYGQPLASPVLTWLPLFAGFLTAIGVSLVTCPVLRPRTLSGSEALFISTRYVLTIIMVSVVALACVRAIAPAKSQVGFRIILLRFGGVAAWFAPVLVFFTRRSIWAALTAAALAASGTTLIHSYHTELEAGNKAPAFEASGIISPSEPTSLSLISMDAPRCVYSWRSCALWQDGHVQPQRWPV
jgi:hypothetical protein